MIIWVSEDEEENDETNRLSKIFSKNISFNNQNRRKNTYFSNQPGSAVSFRWMRSIKSWKKVFVLSRRRPLYYWASTNFLLLAFNLQKWVEAGIQCDQIWRDLAKFRHFGKNFQSLWLLFEGLFCIGQNFEPIGPIFRILGKFSLFSLAQYWRDNFAIWSHWAGYSFPAIQLCAYVKGEGRPS